MQTDATLYYESNGFMEEVLKSAVLENIAFA